MIIASPVVNLRNVHGHPTKIRANMILRICTCTYVLVSWLRGRSKEKLCAHKPCSTGHQTGFIVRINCVRTRQEISKHISIAYNMLYWTMSIFAIKISYHSLYQHNSQYNYHVRYVHMYVHTPTCTTDDDSDGIPA